MTGEIQTSSVSLSWLISMSHFDHFSEYIDLNKQTDTLPEEDISPILFGIFGEVGSLMAAVKKSRREGNVYTEFSNAVKEELGDILWYFTALSRRQNYRVDDIFNQALSSSKSDTTLDSDYPNKSVFPSSDDQYSLLQDKFLCGLGEAVSALLTIRNQDKNKPNLLRDFAEQYLKVLSSAGENLENVINENSKKVRSRFLKPEISMLPTFDLDFHDDERLPSQFEIDIVRRSTNRFQLQWNGVFIGNPLTDNIHTDDGYRFHDVFHMAHAAILHWSPTFRALIKHKRKSSSAVDENEDGGRAIFIEEGLTALIFSHAKDSEYFVSQDKLPFDLLKTIQRFVSGYEVAQCPMSLWEQAILEGYRVFREVRKNEGGTIVGNRNNRTIEFRQLELSSRN